MTESYAAALNRLREALAGFPPALQQQFEAVAPELETSLAPEERIAWAENGLTLARFSLRSWEAALEYFRASPPVLAQHQFPRFQEWVRTGLTLAEESPALAGAYFRASPAALRYLSVTQTRDWGTQGQSLYKGTWKSGSLAAQYFEVSPAVLAQLPLGQMKLVVELTDALAAHSYELASACLSMVAGVLEELDRADRAPFLEFGSVVASTAWADARVYFERGPGVLRQVQPPQRARYLALCGRVALKVGRQGHPLFIEAAQALTEVEQERHSDLIELAEGLVPRSAVAAMELLKSAPQVLRLLRPEDLGRWQAEGLRILEASVDGGEAFFRLESSKGEEILETLSARVDLDRISALLRMYCKALIGSDVDVLSAEELASKGMGWVNQSTPTTEGTTIYLPPQVEDYPSKAENFTVYKIFATHQAGRLEFGSFGFRFDQPAATFDDQRPARAAGHDAGGALTEMERFFDLFPDRKLAHDLFTIVEDARIDTILKREYPGIRAALQRLQRRAVEVRRPVADMPARQAMVENLLRASLDERGAIRWPPDLAALLRPALAWIDRIRQPATIVEDSAEATLRLYDWLAEIPNVDIDTPEWEPMDETGEPGEEAEETVPLPVGAGEGAEMPRLAGEDQPYESPEPVDFRGEFKPELVQLLMRLRAPEDGSEGEAPLAPLTQEQLQELLEKSVEIDLSEVTEGELTESSGLFLDNLLREANIAQQQRPADHDQADIASGQEEDPEPLPDEVESFYYDEWDFRANDYKPRWCRVRERPLERGDTDFYENTLREHVALVQQTRKQFELLRPELFRKVKHLPDGEDYDLDSVVEWHVQRTAHAPTDPNLFYRRNKVERDVAVAFLLDMSASTDEEIHKSPRRHQDDDQFDDDPRKYLSWWAQQRAREARHPSRRIIDLEKDAIVLLVEALETIGDRYGIYGFSGYGRDNVEFYVIKDIDEPFSENTKRRIDKVSPVRSTRMGPAIRHCTTKLQEVQAKVRLLVLLSDGRPQDHGYGRDRTEKEYAIHDTKMALTEARRDGMVPFCLTVDRAGHDYLQQMCEDMGYEVVADIEQLPSRLPTLYRRLTQ